jgi:hypothetical protein
MTVRTLRLALGALVALALASATWAQEQDAFLQRYDLAMEHLEAAVEAMPVDTISARNSVDRAFASLLTLSRDAAGSNLVAGMQRVFERARTAITNGSRDDVAVQVAVLEGGFQRLVYDAALRSALAGDLPTARLRLARVAEDVGFAAADAAALVDASQPTATLRFLVEAGASDVIRTRLAVARELAPTDPGASYRALAQAYGHFLLVQDSPRAVATLNRTFVDAATALVDGDTDTVVLGIEAVDAEIAALGTAARERRASVPGGGSALAVQPALLPGVDGPATEETALEATDPAAELQTEVGGEVAILDVTAFLMELQETERRERLDALEAELAGAEMPVAQRPAHAERLLDAGFESLSAVVSSVAASGNRAVAAVHVGDDARARGAVAEAGDGYLRLLSPILRARDARLDTATVELLAQLTEVGALRLQDVVVLAGQIDGVGAAILERRPLPALQRGAQATTAVWAGPVRDIVSLAIGLLALVPLFLLNLAFGGGNRHWQTIGVALFLLWLPALFEGVVGLGGVLARYAGFDALLVLAPYSVLGNAQAQTVWAALTLLAIVFAIAGLSGISRQFGLLGSRRATPSTKATTVRRPTEATAKTVDWDDEG